jgi:hypothetical protein
VTAVTWKVIQHGWEVRSADGEHIGVVFLVVGDENEDIFDGLIVALSELDRKYVPSEVVGPITEGGIALTISAAQVAELSANP